MGKRIMGKDTKERGMTDKLDKKDVSVANIDIVLGANVQEDAVCMPCATRK